MILPGGRVFHALDHAAAAVQVAHHVAHVLFGRDDLDLHDRLEQHRLGLCRAFLEAPSSRRS
jgi:hypothetical protein